MGCGGVELFGLILTLNRLSVGKKLCYRREEVFRGTAEGVRNQHNGEVGGGRVVKTIKLARPNGEYQCPVKELLGRVPLEQASQRQSRFPKS